jgi:hypothetical protein
VNTALYYSLHRITHESTEPCASFPPSTVKSHKLANCLNSTTGKSVLPGAKCGALIVQKNPKYEPNVGTHGASMR